MTSLSAPLWLEDARLWLQGGWLALFGLALWLSIWALKTPQRAFLRGAARGFWVAAMLGFMWGWMLGPIAEMMRRVALVSGFHLVMALGAFSVLLAGVLSLVREWFGPTGREGVRGESVALSLLVLTLAGWWFGGASLQLNPLWRFTPHLANASLPDGWALSLGGATLLGLSHLVRGDEKNERKRVVNPRAAMWWIVSLLLALSLPWRGQNVFAATVFAFSAGAFACKMWRVRPDGPRFLRVNVRSRAVLILLFSTAPLWLGKANWPLWSTHLKPLWNTPLYDFAFAGLVLSTGALLSVRRELRAALAPRFAPRLLLHGAAVGTGAAALLMGPIAAPIFAFWPLCGLFFDLLSPREPFFNVRAAAELDSDSDSRFAQLEPEPEFAASAADARAT